MIISDSKKFIFIAIGGTGTHSIEDHLCQWNRHGEDVYIGPNPLGEERRKYSKHMAAITLRARLDNWDDYFKFSFVRNPWDRIVSACARVEGEVHRQGIIDAIQKAPYRETQWQDQLARLTDEKGEMIVDFVGRYETLQRDFDKICDRIGVPKSHLFKLNSTKHDHYSTYYDHELANMVAEIFRRDIEYFGYRLEPTCL